LPGENERGSRRRAYDRLLAFTSQRYAILEPITTEIRGRPATRGFAAEPSESPLPAGFRRGLAVAFRERASHAASQRLRSLPFARPVAPGAPAAPAPPPSNNWIPIGPMVLRKGQAENRPAVSGRVPGIAIAPGGTRIYVASANGGVWRSDDAGAHWRSTMEAFNLQPASLSSDSLACGAIAIHPDNDLRVYVGTGEGDSVWVQGSRVVGTGAYFGVGPIRSDDGGASWQTEPVKPGSPPLAGKSFYRLAVDPADGERVVAATVVGLYRREPDSAGGYWWAQKKPGIFSSAVAAWRAGTTTFFAANYGGYVWTSLDGDGWTALSTGFPDADVGRIGLAVQPNNPDVVYALIARASSTHLLGLYRYDAAPKSWKAVAGVPQTLFGPDLTQPGQGSYDLAITVDPRDPTLLYVGGSTRDSGAQWSSCLYRLSVQASGASYTARADYIGADVHADVHTVELTPGDPDQLWVGCDGGVFMCEGASIAPSFKARNTGLGTITMNHLALHPSEDAVLFCGTQDNGTVRYTGDEAWLHSAPGDGGFVVVNWANPYTVLRTYVYGDVSRATDGGESYGSWADVSVPLGNEDCEFYAPIAGAPPGANPADANVAAFGSIRPWVTTDFGSHWTSIPSGDLDPDSLNGTVLSLVFATASKFYAGTIAGGVYRCELSGGRWTVSALHAAPLLRGPVTGVAVDVADPTGDSIYITLGGNGDYRHVWRFDGATRAWEARSGPSPVSPQSLMDVQHNAIVVDPAAPAMLYAGADIGIWKSTDAGQTWDAFAEGLPEAAVLDLRLHPRRRLLWAATYGRGVYERTIDSEGALPVELYVRDTQLDRGRYPSTSGQPDPTQPGVNVSVGFGPGIKVDAPDASGNYQTASAAIDFFEYIDALDDASAHAATGGGSGVNRVLALVHNRGVVPAAGVVATLLLAATNNGAAPGLPDGFDAEIAAGRTVAGWTTVGTFTISEIRVGSPEVAEFDLPASLLPAPAGGRAYCLLLAVACGADPLSHAGGPVDAVAADDRKITVRYF
jgi:hypothetical protein